MRRSAKGHRRKFTGQQVRAYPERLPGQRGYPDDWQKRKVRPSGQVKWKGRELRISNALIGQEVGLQPIGDGQWSIYYEGLELGTSTNALTASNPPHNSNAPLPHHDQRKLENP